MREVEIKRKDIDYRDFIKRTALEKDYDTLVREPGVFTEDGQIKIIYDVVDIDTADLVSDLRRIKYHEGKRTRGLVSRSRIFGFKPRNSIRSDFCSSTSFAIEEPEVHAKVCTLALDIEKYYEKYNPGGYTRHKSMTDENVRDSWRLGGKSAFTSGIINKNNPLKYHFDAGNFNNVYSMMIVFKEGVAGGYLSMPEYGIGFELKNNSIIMFDGQSILHGVTPITYTSPEGHRFSMVYYSLKQIWKCLEIDEELARIRNKKTEREKTRWKMPEEHKQKLLGRRGKQ